MSLLSVVSSGASLCFSKRGAHELLEFTLQLYQNLEDPFIIKDYENFTKILRISSEAKMTKFNPRKFSKKKLVQPITLNPQEFSNPQKNFNP